MIDCVFCPCSGACISSGTCKHPRVSHPPRKPFCFKLDTSPHIIHFPTGHLRDFNQDQHRIDIQMFAALILASVALHPTLGKSMGNMGKSMGSSASGSSSQTVYESALEMPTEVSSQEWVLRRTQNVDATFAHLCCSAYPGLGRYISMSNVPVPQRLP